MASDPYKRIFVERLCAECVLDVSAWAKDPSDPDDWRFVQVAQLSTHGHHEGMRDWNNGLVRRVKRALAAWRGENLNAWDEFYSREELRQFIDALVAARDHAWPQGEQAV